MKVRAEKNAAAVALGRKGGKKGGLARAAKLTPEERSAIASKAVRARWDRAKAEREDLVLKAEPREQNPVMKTVNADTSDDAVLALLQRVKETDDWTEIRKLSDELERIIFHKQHRTA